MSGFGFTASGIALAIAAALGGWGGYKATRMHYELVIAETRQQLEADQESDRLRQRAAAVQYEGWRAAQRSKSINADREVQHAVQSDPWGALPLPAGVRDALAAASSGTGASVVDGGLPGIPAAPTADERGSRFGLRLGAGLGLRLSGEAQGAR